MSRDIQIVCHRGANQLAPENTYASAQLCIDWGMDFLELDVNTSRDGVMYVFHGPELSRTTNRSSGKLYEIDSAEIDTLDCGAWFAPDFVGTRIPRLDEFLGWIDHRIKLFFDVKWANLDALVSLINRHQLQQECFLWFGRDKLARQFVRLNSGLQIKINATTVEAVQQAHRDYGAGIVEFALADLSPELMQTCQQLDVKTMILQREADHSAFRRIVRSGVDYANVDHGDEFLKVLEAHRAASDRS